MQRRRAPHHGDEWIDVDEPERFLGFGHICDMANFLPPEEHVIHQPIGFIHFTDKKPQEPERKPRARKRRTKRRSA